MTTIRLSRILAPTDFSDDAGYALNYAAAIAQRYGAELCVLHVVEDILAPAYFGAHYDPAVFPTADLEKAAQGELDKALTGTDITPGTIRRLLRRGSPFQQILEAAKEEQADLIVMGTHGHTGLAHLLLGSTSEHIVRTSPVPVLTIRHPERKAE